MRYFIPFLSILLVGCSIEINQDRYHHFKTVLPVEQFKQIQETVSPTNLLRPLLLIF
ncbi:MAG: hypothetical protein JWQ96_1973 [Segetibacter sp.]|nr:hypothetical protein [Segetibacter sp.]